MRALLHFIKYNNTFPLLLLGVLVVAGAVLAATGDIPSPLSSQNRSLAPKTPTPTDTSLLLQQDLGRYHIKVRIENITENATTYQVQYTFNSLDIVDGRWQETKKQKSLVVQKEMLGQRSLTDYLTEQISQVTQQELAYLSEVQAKLFGGDRQKGQSTKYAGLIGKELALEQSSSEKKDSSSQKEKTAKASDDSPSFATGKVTPSAVPGVSEQELRQLIVQAVADFLAIDTTVPTPPTGESPAPTVAGVSEEVTESNATDTETDAPIDDQPPVVGEPEEVVPTDEVLP